jgi:phospholipid/cholesterol/gamma-HCH transport system substrate-binding protein
VAGILLFGTGLFLIGKRQLLFENRVEFYAEFSRLGGLQPGALVRVAGRDGGEVLDIFEPLSPEAKFRVKFEAVERLHPLIRTDSTASIQTEGVVGAKFLQIQAGSSAAPKAPPDFHLAGKDPVSVADLLEEAQSTISNVNDAIVEVRGDFREIAATAATVAEDAGKIVVDIGDEISKTAASTARLMDHASGIARRLDEGEGTIGKLLRDPTLYDNLSNTAARLQETVGHARQATARIDNLLEEIDNKAVAADIRRTARNFGEASDAIRSAVAGFTSKTGEKGLGERFDSILIDAGEAMSDFAQNMEALKRNWFFRGFFNKRGFYDLDTVSIEQYKKGEFAKNKQRHRFWLELPELFESGEGPETISAHGKSVIDRVMADVLPMALTNPIIVEGYASEGTVIDQFDRSRRRAEAIRKYLIQKFELNPDFVGVMPMGKVESQAGKGTHWDGVSLVLFTDR